MLDTIPLHHGATRSFSSQRSAYRNTTWLLVKLAIGMNHCGQAHSKPFGANVLVTTQLSRIFAYNSLMGVLLLI